MDMKLYEEIKITQGARTDPPSQDHIGFFMIQYFPFNRYFCKANWFMAELD